MGIAERREREREQRRADILDAAEKLFVEKGVANTTMDEVAETAEFSKGTLYLYFKNRDDIFFGVNLRALTILKTLFGEAIKTDGNGLCKVQAIGKAYYRFSQEYPNYFGIFMSFDPEKLDITDPESNGFHCHRCSEEVMSIVAEAVEIGIKDGSIRPELDPMETAYILWGQTTGIIQIIVKQGDHIKSHHDIDPERLIPESFSMIHHALMRHA